MPLVTVTVSLRSVNSVSSARPYTPFTFAFTQVNASLRPLFFSVPTTISVSTSSLVRSVSFASDGIVPVVSM